MNSVSIRCSTFQMILQTMKQAFCLSIELSLCKMTPITSFAFAIKCVVHSHSRRSLGSIKRKKMRRRVSSKKPRKCFKWTSRHLRLEQSFPNSNWSIHLSLWWVCNEKVTTVKSRAQRLSVMLPLVKFYTMDAHMKNTQIKILLMQASTTFLQRSTRSSKMSSRLLLKRKRWPRWTLKETHLV